jgi:hypothetical protein
MARNWLEVLALRGTAWGVPAAESTALTVLVGEAETSLAIAMSNERTPVVTAHGKAAFDALEEKMRYIKSHFFLKPPLTNEDLVSLGLKARGGPKTSIPRPTNQATVDIARPGVHVLELIMHAVASSTPDVHQSDYDFRMYWGVTPAGGANMEAVTRMKRELMKAPVSSKELPHSIFTRRKKERVDFDQEDSGK